MSFGQYQSGGFNKRRRGGGRRFDYDDPRFSQLEERKKRMVGVKRPRDEYETPEDKQKTVTDRLKALLVRIGERSQSSLASNLDMLSKALQVDISHHRDYIVDTMMICIQKLAVKTSIYGTLVGLVNSTEQGFGGNLVARLRSELLQALEDNNANNEIHRVRLLVRFLGCLQNANVILGTDLIKVYKSVLKIAQQNLSRNQKDNIVHIVMSSLCWSGASLANNNPTGLTSVMTAIEIYMDQRGRVDRPLSYRTFKNDNRDYLVDLWEGCKAAAIDKWEKIGSILQPHTEFSRLKKSHQHPLNWPNKNIKWTKSNLLGPVSVYSVPEILDSNVTGDKDIPIVERCIVSEYIFDLFQHFHADAKMCTEQLLNLPSSFPSKCLVVEAIFTHMLALPKSDQPNIFYTRLIVELFKRQPKVWPKVIGAMINTLFHAIEKIDVECRDRVATWFGHHLANFNHQWPWSNWAFTAELSEHSAKRIFVHSVLDTSINFAYYDRVSKTVPDEMKALLPSMHNPTFRFAKRTFLAPGEVHTGPKKLEDLAAELLRMINQRLSPDDVETLLDTHVVPAHGHWARLDLVFLTMLHAGRQSYSHVLSFITTYKSVLKNMTGSRVAQVQLVKLLYEYWIKSSQHVWILVDKLQAFQMVDSLAIIDFLFLDEHVDDFFKPLFAKILTNTINRTLLTTRSVEMALAKSRVEHANIGADGNDSDEDENEQKTKKLEVKIRKLEQKLLKHNNVMADVFQALATNFKRVLIKKLEELQNPDANLLYMTIEARLTQFLRTYCDEIMASADTLEEMVFTPETPERILALWKTIKEYQPEEPDEEEGAVSDDDFDEDEPVAKDEDAPEVGEMATEDSTPTTTETGTIETTTPTPGQGEAMDAE